MAITELVIGKINSLNSKITCLCGRKLELFKLLMLQFKQCMQRQILTTIHYGTLMFLCTAKL